MLMGTLSIVKLLWHTCQQEQKHWLSGDRLCLQYFERRAMSVGSIFRILDKAVR